MDASHFIGTMKIKPPNKKKQSEKAKSKQYHYWLAEEKVKKAGRLPQLNKRNKKVGR